jgi:hypothetical protein
MEFKITIDKKFLTTFSRLLLLNNLQKNFKKPFFLLKTPLITLIEVLLTSSNPLRNAPLLIRNWLLLSFGSQFHFIFAPK